MQREAAVIKRPIISAKSQQNAARSFFLKVFAVLNDLHRRFHVPKAAADDERSPPVKSQIAFLFDFENLRLPIFKI